MFRSKRARIGAGVVAVAAIMAVIAGCGSSSSSSSPSASTPAAAASSSTTSTSSSSSGGSGAGMAIFYYNPSPYGVASLKGAQLEAGKLGIKLDAFDANNDPQMQSTQIQDAITTGKYKAFWVWGLNDVALTPIINKAIAQGIKVAAADYTWGPLSAQSVLAASKQPEAGHDRRSGDRSGVDEPHRHDERGVQEAGRKRPLQHRLLAGTCRLPDRHGP